jgi:hypothetical protein
MKYRLYVYCRRNGMSMDAGLQAEIEADSDKEAILELRVKGNSLYKYYDEVHMTYKKVIDGEEVKLNE